MTTTPPPPPPFPGGAGGGGGGGGGDTRRAALADLKIERRARAQLPVSRNSAQLKIEPAHGRFLGATPAHKAPSVGRSATA